MTQVVNSDYQRIPEQIQEFLCQAAKEFAGIYTGQLQNNNVTLEQLYQRPDKLIDSLFEGKRSLSWKELLENKTADRNHVEKSMIVSLEHVCFGYLKAMLLTVTDENRDQPLYYDRIFKKLLFLKHKEEQFKIEMDNQELLFEKERDLERRRREQEGLRDMYTAKTKNGSDEDRQYFS